MTDLDVCPCCGGEVRFGERDHHRDEACVPPERPQTGLVGRMPPIGSDRRFSDAQAEDAIRRLREATERIMAHRTWRGRPFTSRPG